LFYVFLFIVIATFWGQVKVQFINSGFNELTGGIKKLVVIMQGLGLPAWPLGGLYNASLNIVLELAPIIILFLIWRYSFREMGFVFNNIPLIAVLLIITVALGLPSKIILQQPFYKTIILYFIQIFINGLPEELIIFENTKYCTWGYLAYFISHFRAHIHFIDLIHYYLVLNSKLGFINKKEVIVLKKIIVLSTLLLLVIIVFMCSFKKEPERSYDTSSPNAVVQSYFLALNNKDSKFIKTTLTDKDSHVRTKTSDLISAELIELQEFNSSYEEITYKVKYKIQLKKGKDIFGENGVNAKFIRLVKDRQNDRWILREIGEG